MPIPVRKFIFICLLIALSFTGIDAIGAGIKVPRSVPRQFVPNMGQWQGNFSFKTEVPGGAIFFNEGGFTYLQKDTSSYSLLHSLVQPNYSQMAENGFLKSHAFQMRFEGAMATCAISGNRQQSFYHNYYLGSRQNWRSRVPVFAGLNYTNIYPETDIEVFGTSTGIKYNIIVKPGADIGTIKLKFEGAENVSIQNGKLHIVTSVNQLVEEIPYAYTNKHGTITPIHCEYVKTETGSYSFRIVGGYDKTAIIVIDPVVVFSTYSGSSADNFGFTATYDSKGNLYAGGITEATGYPTTLGSFQVAYKGGDTYNPISGFGNNPWDITISKYNPTGDTLLFATYLGGSRNEYPHSLLADYSDNLLILGTTFSPDFPTSPLAYDTSYNGKRVFNDWSDIVITKLSSDGSSLLAATYLGGENHDGLNLNTNLAYNYADEFRGDLIMDKDNNYYVGSATLSDTFPMVNPLQATKKGPIDGIVFKIDSSLQNIIWSTYLGGSAADAVYSIRLDKSNRVCIAGGTNSNDLPVSSNAWQKTHKGGTDGFAAIIENDGQSIRNLTYAGTNKHDESYFIDVDAQDNIYLAGQSEGNMPVTGGTYTNANSGQFILKLSHSLDTLLVATVIGTGKGAPDISPTAFLVDYCGFIYLSGWGSQLNKPLSTNGLPITSNAYQSITDGNDFYLIALGRNASSLLYATYFGGNQTEDHVDGGTSRFDKRGVIYESVCASCSNFQNLSDFPTTPGAKFTTNKAQRCNNASFKIDFQLQSAVIADFRPTPRVACFPAPVSMNNVSIRGKSFHWDFGDGTTDSFTLNPVHNYAKPGKYKIRLIVIDSNTCNLHDTVYDEVQQLEYSKAAFTYEIVLCERKLKFSNQSQNAISYHWDFGDGTLDSLSTKPQHTYKVPGKYTIRLITNRGQICADTSTLDVDFDKIKDEEIIIPNVITPNGDGLNEYLEVRGLNEQCDKFRMRVYNRWGEKLFDTNKIGNWWNGQDTEGVKLPDGVYYYVFEAEKHDGKKVKIKGDVTVVR